MEYFLNEPTIQFPLDATVWINLHLCFPFSLFLIILCCAIKPSRVPTTYYVNLLTANLIQSSSLIVTLKGIYPDRIRLGFALYGYFGIPGLCFRMLIALERCFFVSWPQLNCIRQLFGLVVNCVLVWVLCIGLVPVFAAFGLGIYILMFLLLTSIVFIICLFVTLRARPAASSASAEGKHRTVAALVLLLVNYSAMVLPTLIYALVHNDFLYNRMVYHSTANLRTLLLLSPMLDLVLLVFMCKGPADKLLRSFCCRMGNDSDQEIELQQVSSERELEDVREQT